MGRRRTARGKAGAIFTRFRPDRLTLRQSARFCAKVSMIVDR